MRSTNQEWYLLAEYPMIEIMPDQGKADGPKSGFLFQTCRELGAPPGWIRKVEMTLTGFAKEARGPFKQGSLESLGCIRVFCQKKVIDSANSAQAVRPDHTEQMMETAPIINNSSSKMNGGWGCFIIEKSGDSAGSSERSQPFVDLYLYKEGE